MSYGLFLWLNLGWDGPPPGEQRHRLRVWCDAYGLTGRHSVLGEVKHQVSLTVRRLRGETDEDGAAWWQAQLQWIEQHQQQLWDLTVTAFLSPACAFVRRRPHRFPAYQMTCSARFS